MPENITIRSEFDSCAVYAAVVKGPESASRPLWIDALEALQAMEHRAGWVDGASDGTGLLTEVPWTVWERRGVRSHDHPLLLTLAISIGEERSVAETVREIAGRLGLNVRGGWLDLTDRDQGLWSAALLSGQSLSATLRVQVLERLESVFPGKVAVFSEQLAAFKARLSSRALMAEAQHYWGLHFHPRFVLGHNRFSTNTTTELMRVQPFLHLAHNGEINTVERMRRELEGLGVNPVWDGSDSQSLDRALVQLQELWGLSLGELVRMVSLPSPAITQQWPDLWKDALARMEGLFGPVVQGPQALVASDGSSLVAAVDAMGLRPLWVLETEDQVILSSEPGVVSPSSWVAEPRQVGPGEVLEWSWRNGAGLTFRDSDQIMAGLARRVETWKASAPLRGPRLRSSGAPPEPRLSPGQLAANGWSQDDLNVAKSLRQQDPIGSLGFDGPLAALQGGAPPLADFLQETVAVVTNPALDREREAEHFRIDVKIGPRPKRPGDLEAAGYLCLADPWIGTEEAAHLRDTFGDRLVTLPLRWREGTTELQSAETLAALAALKVSEGAEVLMLDDEGGVGSHDSLGLDPVLAVSAIMAALADGDMTRKASIVVKSAMIRNLHDASVLLGLGAGALWPYALWQQLGHQGPSETLNHGLEKILSTMGTHWLAGYGRNVSAIGLPEAYARLLSVPTYGAPQLSDFDRVRQEVFQMRRRLLDADERPRFIPRANTHVYKAAHRLVTGEIDGVTYHRAVRDVERQLPTQMRHVLRVVRMEGRSPTARASVRVGQHDYPFVISSMSFGSQGEVAFRAYAEAAKRLNIIAMNGEGGEIPDMIGRYTPWRGYQVASGRFGVNARLLLGASYAEIKIGQGAKPGEGGHLPGRKVSAKVAEARRAQVGVDLISPSNNHDLYSIEDLRQLIDELKTINAKLQVVVKVPVVPNIGTIAVGIVKAGANVISLSGFDGGTGAARLHALRHVGLPAEVGVALVHQTLLQAGVRSRVEIWADGGVRGADDALKYVLLGANRVGFGTMAMVALGCTICRQCQKDSCHVGITTQIETVEEARARGIKRFQPQEPNEAVGRLVRYFEAVGDELRERLAHLGFSSIQEAVGQWGYLRQWGAHERLDFVGWVESLVSAGTWLSEVNGPGVEETVLPAHAHDGSLPRMRLAGVALAGERLLEPRSLTVEGVAGQGFGAFLNEGLSLVAIGGAQDGVAKGASGGRVWVMRNGGLGGHVGKSLAYGAQGGTVVVQGSADARAGVRLAGARVIIMGDGLPKPSPSGWASAAIKGFGFEYMTRGEGLVLADPGPWLASGMTGGTIYLRHHPEAGLTKAWLRSRISRSARVELKEVEDLDVPTLRELLDEARSALLNTGQAKRAEEVARLAADPMGYFVKVVPQQLQTDQEVSTE